MRTNLAHFRQSCRVGHPSNCNIEFMLSLIRISSPRAVKHKASYSISILLILLDRNCIEVTAKYWPPT